MNKTTTNAVRFEVLILPSAPWSTLQERFQRLDALGVDIAGVADHFVDWTRPENLWFDFPTLLGAAAQLTHTLRLRPTVAQIPLRDPGTFARHILSLDHISGGRIEIGLGIGLEIDPSYAMMGIENWSPRERVARLPEYVEIVDSLLRNSVTHYAGEYYRIDGAHMQPRPVQSPRPPLMIAAMGPVMLRRAARYADIWNSLSFESDPKRQRDQTRERCARIDEACAAIDRDPASLARSYTLFDGEARKSGGQFRYYASAQAFEDEVSPLLELGITEFTLYHPLLAEQETVLERIATDVMPRLRAASA